MAHTVKLLLTAAYASVVLGQTIQVFDVGTPTSGGGGSSTACIPSCEIKLYGAGDACPDGSSVTFASACYMLNDRNFPTTLNFEPQGEKGCDDFKGSFNNHQFIITGNSGQFNLDVSIIKCYESVEHGQCAPNYPPHGGCDVQ